MCGRQLSGYTTYILCQTSPTVVDYLWHPKHFHSGSFNMEWTCIVHAWDDKRRQCVCVITDYCLGTLHTYYARLVLYYARLVLYSPTVVDYLWHPKHFHSGSFNMEWTCIVHAWDDKRRQESKCVCVITDDGPIQQYYTTSSNNSAIFSTADPSISYTCMIEKCTNQYCSFF